MWDFFVNLVQYTTIRTEIMNKIFTLALVAFTASAFAQSPSLVVFQDYDGNPVANGTEVTYTDVATVPLMESKIEVGLSSGVPSSDVNLKRYELNQLAGTGNYFCWGLCYLEQTAGAKPFWDSTDPLFGMQPGTFTSNFHAYHKPYGAVGTQKFRYVWYDLNNPSDTAWLDITFVTDPVGIEELTDPVLEFSVFPNPANEGEASASVDLAGGTNGSIVLHNVLGEQLFVENVSSQTGLVTLPVQELGSGVYFVSVAIEGIMKRTERLVIR